jgi:hypothetical protein
LATAGRGHGLRVGCFCCSMFWHNIVRLGVDTDCVSAVFVGIILLRLGVDTDWVSAVFVVQCFGNIAGRGHGLGVGCFCWQNIVGIILLA